MKDATGSAAGKVGLFVTGAIVAVAAVAILTYHAMPKPVVGSQCTSTCEVPVEPYMSSTFFCRLSVGTIGVPKGSVVSWELQSIDGDPVQFVDGLVEFEDAGQKPNVKLVSPTTVTWTASNVSSGQQLKYYIHAERVTGGWVDHLSCKSANPLIVNVAQ